MEDIERELVGLAELLFVGGEDLGQVDFVVDEDDPLGFVGIRRGGKSYPQEDPALIAFRNSQVLFLEFEVVAVRLLELVEDPVPLRKFLHVFEHCQESYVDDPSLLQSLFNFDEEGTLLHRIVD